MEKEKKDKKKSNRLDLIQKLVRQTRIEILLMSQTLLNRDSKNCYQRKKVENNGTYNTFTDHCPRNE